MKRLYIILFLLLIITFTAATEPRILDLDSCLKLALDNNPDLRISEISMRTAARNLDSSWNKFLPQVTTGAGVSGSTPVISGSPDFSWGVSGSLSLSLSLSAGIANSIESIRLLYQKEEISLRTAQQNLKNSVEKEFYYLITAGSNLDIVKANMSLAQKNYEQAKINYNYGRASELSVLQAQVNAANLEPVYKQTLAAYKSRVNDFKLVLGLSPDAEIKLSGDLETDPINFDAEKLAARYIENRADITAQRKNLEILQNNRTLTSLNSLAPSLSITTGWRAGSLPAWSDSLSLGLSLNVPIGNFIPGSSASLSIAAIDDQIESATISLEKAIGNARTQIYNLTAQLDTAAANMKLSEINTTLAKKTYEMSEESFARGSIQRLDVEDAQQSFLEAKQQFLSSQYNYLTGLIALRDALGMESLEDLYSTGAVNE